MPEKMTRNQWICQCFQEECGEVALSAIALGVSKRMSKALRFGFEEIQPGQELNNAERLEEELTDFYAVVEMMVERGIIQPVSRLGIVAKKDNVGKFLAYATDQGVIRDA